MCIRDSINAEYGVRDTAMSGGKWISTLRCVFTLSMVLSSDCIGGFHPWKVGSILEGLLKSLGVKTQPDALSAGFDVDKCELDFTPVHDKLHGAFQAMEFGSTAEIKQGASVEMGWDQELGCRDSHAISRAQPPREGHAELRAEPAVSQSERGCRGHGDCSER
eukprot:TRINITY_DN3707_c0_g1_i7.p3 TRINITY_DN3707_c0_g1~~TRINITY_DN3707_c0_g1_i7.p3  ORF type:complete len:163 (+),score=29.27 TRINITY_DN3707_c0_g1_i7:140-628(+)